MQITRDQADEWPDRFMPRLPLLAINLIQFQFMFMSIEPINNKGTLQGTKTLYNYNPTNPT